MNSATYVGVTFGELVSVAAVIVAVLWTLGKIGLTQFKTMIDSRFETIDEKLKSFDPLHGELARLDKDLMQVRLEMATNFVRQEGLRRIETKMEQLFDQVFKKLDSKVDKAECERSHG